MKITLNTANQITELNGCEYSINDLLLFATENSCSDLFIKVGEKPHVYKYKKMITLNCAPITQESWNMWANEAINSEMNSYYVRERFYDFSYNLEGNRYRINIAYSMGMNTMVARTISNNKPMFDDYGGWVKYPTNVKHALRDCLETGKNGMVLITGVTGSGKSSTMAACINSWGCANECMSDANMITLEDPIENLFINKDGFRVTQLELRTDFLDFPSAITSAMRQAPTHILVGELRDQETVKAAVDISLSGHCCLSTYHTRSVAATITRLIGNAGNNNKSFGIDIISNLSLIVSQSLKPRKDGDGYAIHVEFMMLDVRIKQRLCEAIQNDESIELVVNEIISEISDDILRYGNYNL